MFDELLRDLRRTLPAFVRRFGTDAKWPAYLVRALWPERFRCSGCGHREAYSHNERLIEECSACGKQHSILAGTMFEQIKTGLSKWFLAIYLVTLSKGGTRRSNCSGSWTLAATARLGLGCTRFAAP